MQDMPDDEIIKEAGERFKVIFEARDRIKAHLGDKTIVDGSDNGTVGEVECPKCDGVLRFRYANYNGHIHGRCDTDGCLSWME